MTASIETNLFANRSRLKELRMAHRELDTTIADLNKRAHVDQIQMKADFNCLKLLCSSCKVLLAS